jgi:hypothetical protein
MRTLAIIILALFIVNAQAQNPAADVRLIMQLQEQSWNRGDIPGFMAHYWKSDSLKFIGSSGITYGWQNTIEKYEKAYPSKEAMGELHFTLIEVTPLAKDAVYVIGKWELIKEKPAGGHFTLLWRKIDKKWVIVSDHTS